MLTQFLNDRKLKPRDVEFVEMQSRYIISV